VPQLGDVLVHDFPSLDASVFVLTAACFHAALPMGMEVACKFYQRGARDRQISQGMSALSDNQQAAARGSR
jgi:hypothetical protein